MKEYIGKKVEVSDVGRKWVEGELLAVLPDDITCRYVIRDAKEKTSSTNWKYARPIKEKTYYYKYDKLYEGEFIGTTNHLSDKYAKDNDITKENGWYKIESSKRTWEH